ncbi:MAG: translocation/assembly module TamB domain-containing protein, partial [Catalinimonas sp.]
TLLGTIDFVDLANPVLDLRFKTDEFRFLNSGQYQGNEEFYGVLFAAADIKLKGPATTALEVTGSLKTLDNSTPVLNLNTGGVAAIQPAAWVTHIDAQTDTIIAGGEAEFGDSLAMQDIDSVETTGVHVDLDIELTEGMLVTVIIDDDNQLQMASNSNLSIDMSRQGDLTIVGDVRIVEGAYAISLFGAVNKRFTIREGSVIRLNGSPTDATFDLTAVYTTATQFAPIVPGEPPSIARQRLPVNVLLQIKEDLTKPQIGFDLDLPEETANALPFSIRAQFDQIRNDENRRLKQVFGLVALDQFVPDGGSTIESDRNGTIARQVDQTVSQVLTSQLNELSQDYLGGVEVSVDLQSKGNAAGTYSDDFNDKELAVSLSKQLFNDRLRVTVGSNVDLQSESSAGAQGQNTNQGVSNVVGDIIVQYLLLPNQNVSVKFFRRTNQNRTVSVSNNNPEIIGTSLSHSVDFESLRKLLGFDRGEYDLKEEEEEPQPEETPEKVPEAETSTRR